MAVLYPNDPVGTMPPEVLRIFRFVKTLPKEWKIWHRLTPWQEDMPDFLLLHENGAVLLLKVSGAAASEARSPAQMMLMSDDAPNFGERESAALARFTDGVGKLNGVADQLTKGIVFPNVTGKQLRQARPDGETDPLWLGREFLQEKSPEAWTPLFQKPSLSAEQMDVLRAAFTPEIIVPASITVRKPTRSLGAGLTSFLLDYNQEWVVKTGLNLDPEGERLSSEFGLRVVNGVAGSGKTLILLYRLRLLQTMFPNKRFLVLTHNRPLIQDMQMKYSHLPGERPPNVSWHTFTGWCFQHWPKGKWRKPVGERRRTQVIRRVWQEFFAGTSITEGMLSGEIEWVKDQLIFSEDAYFEADRRGRGFRVADRRRMLAAIGRYQQAMEARNWVDWSDVPRNMWRFLENGKVRPGTYDVVLIDEAQFFAPVWFEIVQRLVKKRTGHLFAVADPTQGFLGQGRSWRSLGMEVRGRTYRLRRSYRTTRAILSFAADFYRRRVPEEDEEEILQPDLRRMPGGEPPEIIPLTARQDEIVRTANEIAEILGRGIPPEHILVLHEDWRGVEQVIREINGRVGEGTAADPKKERPGGFVRVTTLNAGTGLEAPLVFLLGVNRLLEAEGSLRLSEEERRALRVENTRKIYMAATRAGQRLVITYVGEPPEDLRTVG